MTAKQNVAVGIDDVEGTPVPIPNTEVKLNGVEDTWSVTTRENREMPTPYSSRPTGRLLFLYKIKEPTKNKIRQLGAHPVRV